MRIRQGIGRNSQSQILLILDAILRRHPAESAKPTATRHAETTARPPSAACECVMAYPLGSPPPRCSKWARGSLFAFTLAKSITFPYIKYYMFCFVYDKHASSTNQEGSSFGAMGRSAGRRGGDMMWQDAVPRAVA